MDGTAPPSGTLRPHSDVSLTLFLYAVTLLPAPQPPLSTTQLKLLGHTHRLLQALAHSLQAKPLVQAAARLATAIRALPENTAHLSHLITLLGSAVASFTDVPDLPAYLDDLVDVYCDAEQSFTATIPRDT